MRRLYAIVAAGAVVAAACGGAAPPSGSVTIIGSEYKFAPDAVRLKVGQEVRITFRNDGEKDHEFMIGRTVMKKSGRSAGYETWLLKGTQVRFERDGKEIMAMEAMGGDMEEAPDVGMMLVKQRGSPMTVIFTVPDMPGEWEMGCFEEDGAHYDDGMKGKVTVEK